MEAIDLFHPARMADRILGMGDVVSLVERAQEQFDLEEAKKLEKKIRKNQFDFNDFYNQIQQIKKMGNIKDLAAMIPGVGKAIRDVDIPEDAFKGVEAIIQSMTPKERTNPAILNTSRRQRIANIQEVNGLPCFVSATPAGILELLKRYHIETQRKSIAWFWDAAILSANRWLL